VIWQKFTDVLEVTAASIFRVKEWTTQIEVKYNRERGLSYRLWANRKWWLSGDRGSCVFGSTFKRGKMGERVLSWKTWKKGEFKEMSVRDCVPVEH
jgi:hypothetical protein